MQKLKEITKPFKHFFKYDTQTDGQNRKNIAKEIFTKD